MQVSPTRYEHRITGMVSKTSGTATPRRMHDASLVIQGPKLRLRRPYFRPAMLDRD